MTLSCKWLQWWRRLDGISQTTDPVIIIRIFQILHNERDNPIIEQTNKYDDSFRKCIIPPKYANYSALAKMPQPQFVQRNACGLYLVVYSYGSRKCHLQMSNHLQVQVWHGSECVKCQVRCVDGCNTVNVKKKYPNRNVGFFDVLWNSAMPLKNAPKVKGQDLCSTYWHPNLDWIN